MATEPNPKTQPVGEDYQPFQYQLINGLPPGWKLPTDLDLPEKDGKPVESFQEDPQGEIITESITPILDRQHPDGNYCVGVNNGIYWIMAESPLNGCKVPDWFYVPNVPQMREGRFRRSYVMWQDKQAPFLLLEFVNGTGAEERDDTEMEGKFWVYENAIRGNYYGIFDPRRNTLELYCRINEKYQRVLANERGHFSIPELGIELGIWQGTYRRTSGPWLRLWDMKGTLLPLDNERAEQERQRAEHERQRAEQERQRAEQERQRAEQEKLLGEHERQRADKLAAQLRALEIDPDKS